MGGNKSVSIILVLVTLVLASVAGICSAKNVVVGGTTGWTIPPSPSFYTNWASQQNLQLGDVLVFNFPQGAHTVAEVSKANYDSCTSASTIGSIITSAPANITLTTPGSHYFVCTIPGHCGLNQKLTVSITAASTPAPTPAPSSKKSPTPTPISPSVTAPPTTPPSPSPSPSLSPVDMGPSASIFPMGPSTLGQPGSGAGFAAATGVSIFSFFAVAAAAFALVF